MREKILFDEDWSFYKGDILLKEPDYKGAMYIQAKTERARFGPASKQFIACLDDYSMVHELNPEKWINVNLPHDYIIEQAPEEQYNNALGYFKYENAWYRKKFTLSEEDKDKRICLFFEGIATHATIYLNGCLVKRNFCGYTSFEVDITEFAEFGEENILAVYVETKEHEGWWYEGGGIYRHVWLVKTEKVAVDLWGLYVAPEKCADGWKIKVENTIRNDLYEDKNVRVVTSIVEGNKKVLELAEESLVCQQEKKTITMVESFKNPHLWNLEAPFQYVAASEVFVNDVLFDRYETKFGFREFTFNKNEGMFLNGKHTLIKGVCAHQDFGLMGKAVSDNIQRYKLELIKEMGANGYRCSHYPHSEATMDALDELGFIVMAETRWFDSSDEGLAQLEMLIKRDRNRPSVCFWSVANEEPKQNTESGRKICRKMIARVKSLDNTRVVMAAVDRPENATLYDELDAIGVNYNLDKIDMLHEKYPDKPIFSSECCATGTTRAWYNDDNPQKGYINSFDKDTNSWFLGRENTWKFLMERKWILGGYQWIAFEHRGECMWPRLCSQSGAIDLFLQKKDAFYQNQSHWIEDRPILHLLPHWNFEGLEGEYIRVGVYTNCDAVELFLNGVSLGKQDVPKYTRVEWQVKYEKGELLAVGYNNGKMVIEDKKITSGNAYRLALRLENKIEKANGKDVAFVTCYCVDENGIEAPDAIPFVRFTTNSLGKIRGTGSDICDHIPVPETDRRMRAGRISVAVEVGKVAGDLKLYAEADGLKSAVLTIKLS